LREEDDLMTVRQTQGTIHIGPIRQEFLSGVKTNEQLKLRRDQLRAFPDWELESDDFELAAGGNRARKGDILIRRTKEGRGNCA
jgi:hypothetical protein